MRHIKLSLQYDGTNYSGWQVQVKETTIQGLLENALFTITGEKNRITGAARTDAGVHAIQQAAVFRTESKLEADILQRAINANLPKDIRVIGAVECSSDFHPRYDAESKTYAYLMSRPGAYSVFLNRYSWQLNYPLNCDAMKEAAKYLIGRHDFSSFRASGCSAKNPVREISEITISDTGSIEFMTFNFKAPLIKISIKANAFLRHMVRNIVGTLAETGNGKMPTKKIKEILEAKDRTAAGKTAPACGLFLEKIEY